MNKNIFCRVNKELFGWTIENLCKNSIDALGKEGNIILKIGGDNNRLIVDVIDDGLGIKKNQEHYNIQNI